MAQTKEQQRASSRKHYEANKETMKARARTYTVENRKRLRAHVEALREVAICPDCKGKFPACVMEFDHVRGEKSNDISTMVNRSVSMKTLQAEIDKCEIVCANCHRIRTRDRARWSSSSLPAS
jgi:hypothetical protein